jgi:hypothetical protein
MLSVLQNTSYWIIILPLVIGVSYYKRLSFQSKVILAITVFATPPQLISRFTGNVTVQITFYNLYTPVEFLLTLVFFWPLTRESLYHTFLKGSFVIYLVIAACIIFIHGIVNEVLDCLICINNLFYCFWTLLFLFYDVQLNYASMRFAKPVSFYIISILIYSSATSVYFAIKPYTDEKNINIKLLHNLPNIQMYILFTLGFLGDAKHTNNRFELHTPINEKFVYSSK